MGVWQDLLRLIEVFKDMINQGLTAWIALGVY